MAGIQKHWSSWVTPDSILSIYRCGICDGWFCARLKASHGDRIDYADGRWFCSRACAMQYFGKPK